MRRCNNLVRVSLNIYKLKLLKEVDFSECQALSEARWNDHPIAIDEVLSGLEMPSHFTHQNTGYSLSNIPLRHTLLSQQLFQFRACVVVVFDSEDDVYDFDDLGIDVDSQFKDRLGNSFHWVSKNKVFLSVREDSVLFALDYVIPPDECNAPLAEVNYDYVDMEIYITDTELKLKRWGIQLLEECSSPMNQLSNPFNVADVCIDILVSESEDSEEYVQTAGKRQRETGNFWERPFKKMFSCVRKFF